jgi:3,8-divinyl chlorophyllide a/chlorophyllide a reductase subunit Y
MPEMIMLEPKTPSAAAEPVAQKPCQLHPQTMCPAFGALRVLTRIEGCQPAMVTDTGCLYGLTFVTHFYAARKSIVAPALGTAELSSGKVQEAANAAIAEAAKEPGTQVIPVISLCVAETAGLAEELLPRTADGAEVILVRVPAYAIHSHPEAKDVALAALLRRLCDTSGPRDENTLLLLGEVFPADPVMINAVLAKMGVRVQVTLPGRTVGALHPFYRDSLAFLREQRMPVVAGAPVGAAGSGAWLRGVGAALDLDEDVVEQVAREEEERALAYLEAQPLKGATVLVSGYEGNELPYARLLVEGGAHVPYISTSIGQSMFTATDEAWLRERGTQQIVYRKSLEDDRQALKQWSFDLVIGTTSLAQYSKEMGIPSIYFTNMLSVRPFFLSNGMIASIEMAKDLLGRKGLYQQMVDFFAE